MTRWGQLRWLGTIASIAVVYIIVAKLSLQLASIHPSATPVWPPTGIAIAAAVLLGYRALPGILIGAFLANVTTEGTILTSLGIALGNMLEAAVAAYFINKFAGGKEVFQKTKNIFFFTLLAAVVAPIVSATLGVGSLSLGGFIPVSDLASVWFTWWLGDVGGALVVAPLIILWARPWPWKWTSYQGIEALVLLLGIILIGEIVFGRSSYLSVSHYPVTFLIIPFLVWTALRFGATFTATATALFAARAVFGTLQGLGPFMGKTPNQSLLLLQAFLGVISVTSLTLAAAIDERRHAFGLLQQERSRLAEHVKEKTSELQDTIAQLQHNQNLLNEAEQIAHVGSWEWLVQEDNINWSPELYRIFGVKLSEFQSTYEEYLQYLHPADRQMADEVIQTAFQQKAPFDFIHRIVRPNGEIRTLRGRGRVEVDASGKVVRMLGTAQDITEQQS